MKGDCAACPLLPPARSCHLPALATCPLLMVSGPWAFGKQRIIGKKVFRAETAEKAKIAKSLPLTAKPFHKLGRRAFLQDQRERQPFGPARLLCYLCLLCGLCAKRFHCLIQKTRSPRSPNGHAYKRQTRPTKSPHNPAGDCAGSLVWRADARAMRSNRNLCSATLSLPP